MSVNSRKKGARGECEFAKILREKYGFSEARRGQQYSGANGDPDVVGLPGVHLEIKRVERLNVVDAMTQSRNDAKESEIPVVAHKKNRKPWLVTQDLDTWMPMYEAWLKSKNNDTGGKDG